MVKEIITFGDIEIEKGVIHKGCPHKCGNFWESPPPSPPVQVCLHLVDNNDSNHACLAVISLEPALKKDENYYYLQVYKRV